MDAGTTIRLESSQDVLLFDAASGALMSFRSKAVPDQQFIVAGSGQPVFIIQHLDKSRRFRQIASDEAAQIVAAQEIVTSPQLVDVASFEQPPVPIR